MDEGFTDGCDEDFSSSSGTSTLPNGLPEDEQKREDLAYELLSSLSRPRLAKLQRKLAPLLQFDVVGKLPDEVALQIFTHLPAQTLLTCALVSRRWRTLSNEPSLWKEICHARGWIWRHPPRVHQFETRDLDSASNSDDDEGMGDSDSEDMDSHIDTAKADMTLLKSELDSGYASMSLGGNASIPLPPENIPGPSTWSSNALPQTNHVPPRHTIFPAPPQQPPTTTLHATKSNYHRLRHSAPSSLPSWANTTHLAIPDYKLLYQTHTRLKNRFLSSSYRLSALQTRGAPPNAHAHAIYCLQLYTYPNGVQVLFTGSRDKTVREWNLSTGLVERVITGVHNSSILSLCAGSGYLATAGSDRKVALWDLESNELVKVVSHHDDSVLCVRFDEERLVSCSKDRTVRTYSFPDLTPEFVLGAHRAAVNAVSISSTLIVSASGDRSIRLWDATTGRCLRSFENHSSRGIASIDFAPPFILSGSSDKHLRLFDITSLQGWSTAPSHAGGGGANQANSAPDPFLGTSTLVCHSCGTPNVAPYHVQQQGSGNGNNSNNSGSATGGGGRRESEAAGVQRCMHADLVRSVVLGEDLVVSGSYDLSIKVWDRKTGALIADLTGGHTARIFCIAVDYAKIISCGEDQRICLWDFSHGIDTSFIQF